MSALQKTIDGLSLQAAGGIGVGIAILYFAMLYDNGSAITTSITQAQSNISKANETLEKLKPSARQGEIYKKEKDEFKRKSDALLQFIPEKYQETELKQLLSDQAKEVGLNISRMSQDSAGGFRDKNKAFEEVSVAISATGTFAQIMDFMASLTKMKIMLVQKGVKIRTEVSNKKDKGLSLGFDGKFVVYKQASIKK